MEYTMVELDAQLLPSREVPGVFNLALVGAQNIGLAANTLTLNSLAAAGATQTVAVVQL